MHIERAVGWDLARRMIGLTRRPAGLAVLAILAIGGSASVSARATTITDTGRMATVVAASFAGTPTATPPARGPEQEFLPPIPGIVPASGSVEVPVDVEDSSIAAIVVLVASDAVSATVGGAPLAATDSMLGRTLAVTLHDPTEVTLRITNDGASPAPVQVVTWILSDRHVLITTSESWAMQGDTIFFDVLVTHPLEGDKLLVELVDSSHPATPRRPVTVTEDGPGRWIGSITIAKPGPWTLLAQVTGERPRYATAQIEVSAGLARLGDDFAERLVDADGDSLADALVVSPELLVSQAGTYHVNARLVTQDGRGVATAGQTAELSAGSHRVDLSFDGKQIFSVGTPGPYRLVDVTVFDEASASSAGPEDRRADLGSTEAYEIDRFQHPPVVLDGASYRVLPLDDDGDGRFETIRLTGTVTVALAGSYDLGAQLLADDGSLNGEPVDYASKRLLLEVGANDFALDFDGGAIEAAGMDGPYEIRRPALTLRNDHDISGSGPSTFTGPLQASDFEARPADPDATPPSMRDVPEGDLIGPRRLARRASPWLALLVSRRE